jgi:hypothetical protein
MTLLVRLKGLIVTDIYNNGVETQSGIFSRRAGQWKGHPERTDQRKVWIQASVSRRSFTIGGT